MDESKNGSVAEMKIKLIALLLILALLLAGCGYVAVENPERQSIGSLLMPSAAAEGEEDTGPYAENTEEITKEAPKLERGSSGDDVKKLQELLRVYGFLSGKADGFFGPATENAVKDAQNFKNAKDEAARAEAFERLMEKVRASQNERAKALNSLNSSGDDVRGADIVLTHIAGGIAVPEVREEFRADGVADETLIQYLREEFPVYGSDLKSGASGSEVKRLQTRLKMLNYLAGRADGSFGSDTREAVKYFQRLNGIKETGVADRETQTKLFSAGGKTAPYPVYRYQVEVCVSKQRVYVYEWNYGAYNKQVKTMKCTTGAVDTPTPIGSFKMGGPCGRWYYFAKFECWAQYASRITGGILFHSVLYSEKDESTLRQGSVAALGSRASHGCVRLSVEDAKWIYNNIPAGTTCRVYA